MAQMRGARQLDIGRRGLALNCGLDDSTVSAVLRALREEEDPVIELLQGDRGERGDLYTLRIPDGALEAAAWKRWRPPGSSACTPSSAAAEAEVFAVVGLAAAFAGGELGVGVLGLDAVAQPVRAGRGARQHLDVGVEALDSSAPGAIGQTR